jgi:flagellar hook-associated protein 1 FlgK
MSVSLYQTGVSGLLAAQQHLATTGHNISNVNTDGYTVQRGEQAASIGDSSGGNYIGTGTYISDISRVFSSFTYKEQTVTANNASYSDKLSSQLNELDQTMSIYGGQIESSLENFYRSLHSISDKPDDASLRKMALDQAKTITNDIKNLQERMTGTQKLINNEFSQMADRISTLSVDISKINSQISSSYSENNVGQNNDLLDQRERLLSELNDLVKVDTITDKSGVMTVMIGDGKTLVAGITPLSMYVTAGDPDPSKNQLAISNGKSTLSLEGSHLGGQLGALVDFRDTHLKRASSEIDLLAMGISQTINQSQSEGLDLNQLQGGDIFSDINSGAMPTERVLAHSANNVSNPTPLIAQVTITDVSQLSTDEYEVIYDGANYNLNNLTTGVSNTLGVIGAGPFTLPGLGFQFEENSGTPQANDRFLVRPLQNSAERMNIELKDPQSIAASSPIEVTANDNNVSSGSVTISKITDPIAARTQVMATFPSLTVDVYEDNLLPGTFQYRVFDTSSPPPAAPLASGSYLAGGTATVALSGYEIEITGKLSGLGTDAREQFVISDAFGVGNGNNMLDMAGTQNSSVLNETQTFSQFLTSSVSVVGSEAASLESQLETDVAMANQAISRHQSISGVNLDEEAANMLKYQKAYQASAKVISIANTLFDTILSSLR